MASSSPNMASTLPPTERAYSPTTTRLLRVDTLSLNTPQQREVESCNITSREIRYLKHDVYLSATSAWMPRLSFEMFLDRFRESNTVLFKGSLRTMVSAEKSCVLQTVEVRQIVDEQAVDQEDFGVFPVDGDGKSAPIPLYLLFKSKVPEGLIEVPPTIPGGLRLFRLNDQAEGYGGDQSDLPCISLLPKQGSKPVKPRLISTV